MVLLNPRGHWYNDKFDETEQSNFMDNCEQKKNVQQLEYFVSSHYVHEWILNIEWPRTAEDSQHG